MSVHTWGESPHGQWLLEIRNEGRYMGKFNHSIHMLIGWPNWLAIMENNTTAAAKQ